MHNSLTGMYADDTGLYSTGSSISAMEATMNRDLSKLCFWLLQSWKLICRLFFLSPLPPYTMLADLCRSCSVQPTLILGGGRGGGVGENSDKYEK